MPVPASEADVIQNRINVALAKSQRLVTSWLPPQESTNTKAAEDAEKEEALFTPIPPRLGLGAPIPKEFEDGGLKTQTEFLANGKLRRKLLGAGSSAISRTGQDPMRRRVTTEAAISDRLRPSEVKAAAADSDSDEDGRSAQWKAKRQKTDSVGKSTGVSPTLAAAATAPSREKQAPSRRRANFLDELLQEKSERGKKRKGGKKGKGSEDV